MTKTELIKWYKHILQVLPVIAMLGTLSLWVDTRYMHKEISDIRFVELQVRIIEGQLQMYNRIVDRGDTLTLDEQWRYEMDTEQLKNLTTERNKMLGIGDKK